MEEKIEENNNNQEEHINSKNDTYDFLLLFCYVNYTQNNYFFNRNSLVNFIKKCQETKNFNSTLGEITILNEENYNYSKELEEALFKLNLENKISIIPTKNNLVMYIKNELSNLSLEELKKKDLREQICIVSEFHKYEVNRIREEKQLKKKEESGNIVEKIIKTLKK